VKIVKPGAEHDTPRGILGGAELSQATTGATNIYMAKFRVPAGARSRPHYHANCESGLYMLSGGIAIHWGEHLEQTLEVEPGDLLYVPPRETHVVVNLSDDEPADYVVARDSPTEDSVEVPLGRRGPALGHVRGHRGDEARRLLRRREAEAVAQPAHRAPLADDVAPALEALSPSRPGRRRWRPRQAPARPGCPRVA
jgi:uncharacterized RmlC-like cupin family protein